MGDDADAQDALQEALVAIARGLRRFDGRSAFSTWSYRVATNACLDELRRRRRRPVPDGLGATDDGGGHHAHDAGRLDPLDRTAPPVVGAATGHDPVDAVAQRLEIDAALDRLAPDFRAAVVLRDVCDLDYAEIARVLDLPAGTVRSRIARGRAQLSDLLGNPTHPSDRPSTHR